nr:transporter substrate-binding protein [Marinicella sp. W31]MDC2880012.1 transporter substrate-binding protein [Marinicella sp. W31]
MLFSAGGSYAPLGREAVAGALAAIAEINADENLPIRLAPLIADPQGQRYAHLAEVALREGARHIVGTITSTGRKEVIPVVERQGGLLWYAFPYEGFEASDSTLYFGACPNQHLLPLFDYVLPRYGNRPFVVGSNYIWGWEVARIARELAEAGGGGLAGERYLPLGHTSCDHLISEIRECRPDFILSNLVGESLHAFVRAFHALALEDERFSPEHCPIVSCNMTEADIEELGATACGHITTSSYFDSLNTPENRAFKARIAGRQGHRKAISSCFASVYSAVSVLGHAIAEAGTDDPRIVRRVVTSRRFDTPIGALSVDAATQHAALSCHMAEVGRGGRFHLFDRSIGPIKADPYLSGNAARAAFQSAPLASGAAGLKVVK